MKLTEEKLYYLMFLYETPNKGQTITNLATKLGITKSTMSRVLTTFYQEGITAEKGKSKLSLVGSEMAKKWCEEINKMSDWLMSQSSMNRDEAQKEARCLALHMSEEAKSQILQKASIQKFLPILDGIKQIHGDMLMAHLEDGDYPFAFTLYKDQIENTLSISMANEAFYHPGTLRIEQKKGYLILKNKPIEVESSGGRAVMKARLQQLQYFKGQHFVDTLQWKDSFMIPITSIAFHYNNYEKVLQGNVKLSMKTDIQKIHMPKMTAILSIVFK